jgi:C-terminal processing protease CtpA/Prc
VVGTFGPADYDGFQVDTVEGIKALKAKGVTKIIVDVHNNPGGYVCLGAFLYLVLAGTKSGYP